MGSSRTIAAALASIALLAAPVMAQPKSPPTRPPQDAASDLVNKAIAKSQAGDHLGAIDLYLQAYGLLPQHLLLSNVGAEYQKAGKPIEALKYFCLYLEKDATGTLATYATAKAKALQIELGNKNVDDKTVCKMPSKTEKPVKPPEDDPVETPETDPKDPVKPPPHDEKKPAGGSSGSGFKYTGIGAIVVGLAGVGAGLYFGRKAQEKSDFITNHPMNEMWPDDIRQIEADGQRYEDRQIQLTIVGSALVVAGGVLYVIGATRGSSPEKVSVRPTATANSFGLAVGGGF